MAPRRRVLSTAAFVGRSLAILRDEAPAAYHRLADELRPGAVHMDVAGDRFAVEVRDDRPRVVRGGARGATGWVTADDGVVLDLIDGRLDLLGAVEAGRLDVRGDCETVLRLARALTAFTEGAVRSPGARALLDDYRSTNAG